MLQISAGRYFRDVELYETVHSATFFTNAVVEDPAPVEVPFGTVTFETGPGPVSTVVITATERLEGVDLDGAGSFVRSVGGTQLLDEAAAVVAFAANITLSRHQPILERTVTEPARGPSASPSGIFARTFDPAVVLTAVDFDDIRAVCSTLLELNRREYEAAMRAMRKVVDATLMVADDPGLAYTLFVSALESLAQVSPESERELSWDRYDDGKKKFLDPVLANLPASDADEVRMAILEADQLQLSRRFRTFTAAHIAPSYYRSEAEGVKWPLRAHDLEHALTVAYRLRSRNVHNLLGLDTKLWAVTDRADTLRWEGRWVLSLEGLNRLSRHILRQFIDRAPIAVDPGFNYRRHLPGMIYNPEFIPEMELGRKESFTGKDAPKELSGLVSILLDLTAGRAATPVAINMDRILDQIEGHLTGMRSSDQRTAMVAIYVLWRAFTPERDRPRAEKILEEFGPDLDPPGLVAFAVPAILGYIPDWPADAWADLAATRRRALVRGKGQPMPPTIDTALLLCASLVNGADPGLAADLMSQAVESDPGNERLILLEQLASDDEVHDVSVDVIGYLRGAPDWVEVTENGAAASLPDAEPDGAPPAA